MKDQKTREVVVEPGKVWKAEKTVTISKEAWEKAVAVLQVLVFEQDGDKNYFVLDDGSCTSINEALMLLKKTR